MAKLAKRALELRLVDALVFPYFINAKSKMALAAAATGAKPPIDKITCFEFARDGARQLEHRRRDRGHLGRINEKCEHVVTCRGEEQLAFDDRQFGRMSIADELCRRRRWPRPEPDVALVQDGPSVIVDDEEGVVSHRANIRADIPDPPVAPRAPTPFGHFD